MKPLVDSYDQSTQLLSSFGENINVAVIGASGGLGRAFVDNLSEQPAVRSVLAMSRSGKISTNQRLQAAHLDLLDEASIQAAANRAKAKLGHLDLVLVATGLLHDGVDMQPEKSWRAVEAEAMQRAFAVNTIGPALVAKHFLPLLARDKKSAFAAISARVGSISDNGLGGWHAYRASKAALNMVIKTLSVELARKNHEALLVGLHPGTVDTPLSKPFQRSVPDSKLFTPDQSAGYMLSVLDDLTPDDSGGLYAWDGAKIDF